MGSLTHKLSFLVPSEAKAAEEARIRAEQEAKAQREREAAGTLLHLTLPIEGLFVIAASPHYCNNFRFNPYAEAKAAEEERLRIEKEEKARIEREAAGTLIVSSFITYVLPSWKQI